MHDSPLHAEEHFAEPLDVEQAGRGVGARRLQQDVVGLVAAQHVVDEVGRDGDLPPGLLLARMLPLDQPGDDGAVPERALQKIRIRRATLRDRRRACPRRRDRRATACRRRTARRDRAAPRSRANSRWRRSRAAAPARAPAGGSEACRASGARAAPRRCRRPCRSGRRAETSRPAAPTAPGSSEFSCWNCSHSQTCVGRLVQRCRIGEDLAHLAREIGRQRKLAALIGGDHRVLCVGRADIGDVLADAFELQHAAGEAERVAVR